LRQWNTNCSRRQSSSVPKKESGHRRRPARASPLLRCQERCQEHQDQEHQEQHQEEQEEQEEQEQEQEQQQEQQQQQQQDQDQDFCPAMQLISLRCPRPRLLSPCQSRSLRHSQAPCRHHMHIRPRC
jgi:hypothetical protein